MEKFIVSARKYRPQTFDTVVGQEHITTTLKNAIKTGHLAHAFLFCGPRGVGKTTCARILAKTINCEHPTKDGEACNECNSCRSFNDGTSLNIHELDAASNNSVEDIRSLVEQVRFAPQAGKYKVYIIDEVHMLSSSAFNAFLKTLEEPPPYAIFILATTEKHKILPTILSRCQIFDFKRITLQDTVDHLESIARKEHITTQETALQLIAQKSEGCMRDALSILDKIVSFTGGDVTYENTIEHLNILDASYYFKLMDCMLAQDLAGALLLFDDIDKKGFEGDIVLNGFAEFVRNLLICKDERVSTLLEVVESFRKLYQDTAKKTDAGFLISILNILNEAEINYRQARNKRLHVELVIIRLCYLKQALDIANTGNAIDKKKRIESAKAIAFKNISPISQTVSQKSQIQEQPKISQTAATEQILPPGAKLIIQSQSRITQKEETRIEQTQIKEPPKEVDAQSIKPAPKSKISSLESLRKTIEKNNGSDTAVLDEPVSIDALQAAWSKFIVELKSSKNPAFSSFEMASLVVKDQNSFEAVVKNNIEQKFIELERNKVSQFLQKELNNRQLQFYITLTEEPTTTLPKDIPLSSKEQYQKIVEQFPLVKELKDRLRLELDY